MAYTYDPPTKFGYKDTLPPECDEKVIRGTDFDAEFKRIETGVGDSFDETNAGLEQEIEDRIIGDQNLQDQINNLDNTEILNDLNAEIQARIEGDQNLQNQIDSLENYDDTQITADLAAETQARIDGDAALQGQIDDLLAQPGAGMVISETEPTEEERVPGLQWLDSTTAEVWIWDGDRWLEFPAGSGGSSGGSNDDAVLQSGTEDQQVISKFTFTGTPEDIGLGFSTVPNKLIVDTSEKKTFFVAGSPNSGMGDAYDPWDVEIQGSLNMTAMGFPPSYMQYTAYGISKAENVSITYRHADDPDNPVNPDPQPAKWIVKPNLEVEGNGTFSGSFTAGGPVIAQSQMVVSAAAVYRAKADISNGGNGLYFNGNAVLPADATGVSDTEGRFTLGTSQRQWKHVHGIDATFSGTVSGGGSDGQTLGSGRLRLNRATTNYITAESPTADINFQIGGVETDKNVLRIQANGNATFSGSVTAGQVQLETGTYLNGNGAVIKNSTGSAGFIITNNGEQFDPIVDDQINVGDAFRRWKNARFSGKVTANTFDGTVVRSSHVIQDGSPVIDAKGLISTLSTLRNATKDETTLEGLRDSIGNAIGGLIEKFEAEIATMEIPE